MAKVEAVEDFESPALQAVSLAVEDLGTAFVDDAGFDAETGEPVGCHEAGWAGADDENVDVRDIFVCCGGGHVAVVDNMLVNLTVVRHRGQSIKHDIEESFTLPLPTLLTATSSRFLRLHMLRLVYQESQLLNM